MAGAAARSLAVVWLAAACGSRSSAPPPPHDAGQRDGDLALLDGNGLFQKLCSPCHGADAKGYKADHAPSLVSSTFLESASDDFLRGAIERGRPGTSMAAYGKILGGPLDAAEVGKLVAWLRQHGPAPIALPPVGAGDILRGATVYKDNCAKCHGTRAVRGEAVQLANSQLLATASDAYLKWAVVHGRPGTPMEAWQGKLDDGQLDDVIAYVRAFTQPGKQEGQLPPPTGKEPLVLNPRGGQPQFDVRHDDRAYVTIDQVAKALAVGKRMIILDARPEPEWRRVHVAGAVSMPYHDLARLDVLPKDGTWIFAYCACPHHLSGIVVDELAKRGYAHAAVLDEGINEWFRRGYPVVAAPGVEPPPAEAKPTPPPGVGTHR
ncbi:MAG TPA: c-type cytochrome [Kofleriaceae bacterium]|nr:c-type cytochrome [Kofleriaceae bacterium]